MLRRIEQHISRHALLQPGQRVMAALSGGADSVCLLLVLKRLGYAVEAAHCNFHLRGDESDRDQHFVEQLCQRIGVKLHVAHFNTKSHAASQQISIEMAARELRYRWFASFDAPTAIAHHRDDNNETLLLNLIRGTGLHGLTGIQPRAEVLGTQVVRPLLCVGRADILYYLEEEHQDYVTDSTNLELDARRNVIRLRLIPLLATLNPSIGDTLQQDIARFSEAEALYNDALARHCTNVLTPGNGSISIRALDNTPAGQTVLHRLLSPHGFTTSVVEQIYAERHGQGGALYHGADCRLLRHRGHFVFGPKKRNTTLLCNQLPLSGTVAVTTFLRFAISCHTAPLTVSRNSDTATMDIDRLQMPLGVRFTRTGDRFAPYGMKGSMLVSDYLTNHHATLFERERQLVVISGNDIVWLVGHRISRHAAITPSTRQAVTISLIATEAL